jgi:nicotinic acid mononucleotide adenylyltransferase
MDNFAKFLTEDKEVNTHLTHIEDLVIDRGSFGAKEAVDYLKAIKELLGGNSSSAKITTKFDGAPAVIMGKNPDTGKFFVATKSLFAKVPKYSQSIDDIKNNYSNSEALQNKLGAVFDAFKDKKIDGVYQGDLMFTQDDVTPETIDGKQYLTFRANTITYAAPLESDLSKKIRKSKIGMIFHTKYEGDSIADLHTVFGDIDVKPLQSDDIWVQNADMSLAGDAMFDAEESKVFDSTVSEIETKVKSLGKNLDKYSSISSSLNTYINSEIKNGNLELTFDGYVAHLRNKSLTDIDKLKTEKGKLRKIGELDKKLSELGSGKEDLENLFDLHQSLIKAKLQVVSKLNTMSELGSFLKTPTGFKVTSPEGYVAVDKLGNGAIKLVDRLEFSKANFTLEKTWSKDTLKPSAEVKQQLSVIQPKKEETENDSIVVTFGRFNPPTLGHEALVNSLLEYSKSKNTKLKVFLSQSTGNEKNPLEYEEKVRLAAKAFPNANITSEPDVNNPFDILKKLHDEGYKNVRFLVGADRRNDFNRMFSKYIESYGFSSFEVADIPRVAKEGDEEDISATAVRAFAEAGDEQNFADRLPTKLQSDARSIMSLVKSRIEEVKNGTAEEKQIMKKQEQIDDVLQDAERENAKVVVQNHETETKQAKEFVSRQPKMKKVVKRLEKTGEKEANAHPDLSGSIRGLSYTSAETARKSVGMLSGSGLTDERKYGLAKRQYNMAVRSFEKTTNPTKKAKFHAAANQYFEYLRKLSTTSQARKVIGESIESLPVGFDTYICNQRLNEDFECFVEACIFEDIQNGVEDSFFLLSEDKLELLRNEVSEQNLES